MPSTPPRKGLRLDVQGLRALAVALVVVFHLTPKHLPGGYIGVDVFFVISGYLITGHLLREVLRTGRIRIGEFWARRVRRLLPAAFLVLAVSALAVYLFLPATAKAQNFTEIAFAGFYLLNWRLAADSVDYLAEDNAASIAQHYWSLSIEEQFYIVWPILIIIAVWLAARSRRIQPKHAVAGVLVIVLVASLAFSIVETARSQPSAYFITTTRAWEFAVGGLIALLPASRLRGLSHAVLSWAALAVIVACGFRFDAETPFPGWIALLPVLGTACLLWIGDSDHSWSPQYLAKAGPIQLVGDTSYAIYLWHWPLIITVTAILGRAPGWIWGGAILVVTVALAIATKYLVEDPVRKAPGFLKQKVPTYALMATGIAGILAITITPVVIGNAQTEERQAYLAAQMRDEGGCFGAHAILNDCEAPHAITDTVDVAAAQTDTFGNSDERKRDCEGQDIGGRYEYRCERSNGEGAPTLMLLGDSHMYSLYPGFALLADERGWNLTMEARSGCPGHGVASTGSSADKVERCAAWSSEALQRILADDSVKTVAFTAYSINYAGTEEQAAALFATLRSAGKQVVVISDVPGMGEKGRNGPSCVEASGGVDDPCAIPRVAPATWLETTAAAAGATIVDPGEVLCDDDLCHAVIGGTLVYQDDAHLTMAFARTLAPWLRERIGPYLA